MEARKEQQKAQYLKKKEELAKEAEARQKRMAQRSQTYAADLVKAEKETIAAIEKAEAEGSFYVPAEPKVALVLRIRGLNKTHPRVRSILRLLRLRQKHNAVFVRLNKASLEMIRLVENYVAWGYPTPALVRKIIYSHGHAEINRQRVPINSNEIVRVGLGHVGIESLGDLAHEIYSCGPNFTAAARFLWPFKFNNPVGGMKKITRHYNEGGDYGNREHLIGELIERML